MRSASIDSSATGNPALRASAASSPKVTPEIDREALLDDGHLEAEVASTRMT